MIDLLPNLGGEEGPGWRRFLDEPAVRAQRRLWRLLFGAEARLLGDDAPCFWPEAFGPRDAEPILPWLAGGEAFAWLSDADAACDPALDGKALAGPDPTVVAEVHDKAFALGVAAEERLVPPVLRGLATVLEPEVLRGPSAPAAVETALEPWPAWARAHFTLKPRLGSSGRGRLAGEGALDRARLGAGLERLAERGGAILEPWLERRVDLSVQLHVGSDAGVTLLGTLVQDVSPAGVFLGHRGEIDSRGRVFSGHEEEERIREAAALVAVAAAARGYFGPCGVDAFTFADPESGEETLRPVVELNARFTAGTVTVGLIRRLLPYLKAKLGLSPGERLRFRFRASLPDEAREAFAAEAAGEAGLVLLDDGPAPPAFCFARAPAG